MSLTDYVIMPSADYKAACDAIRAKIGSTDPIKSGELPERIASIESGGADAGIGLFWETFQQGGTRKNYSSTQCNFGYGYWTNETFKPKYPMAIPNAQAMFQNGTIDNYEALRTLDFSPCTNFTNAFRDSNVNHLGVIDARGIPNNSTGSFNQVFMGCSQLEEIDGIIFSDDNTLTFSNVFNGANNIRHMPINGKIGVTMGFAGMPYLDNETVQSIIDALRDLTNSTAKTIKFHSNVGAKLTEEQKAQATAKNWTISY